MERDQEENNACCSSTTVSFPTNVYRLDVIKKAAYPLSGLCAIDIALGEADIVCTLTFNPPRNRREVEDVVAGLKREVLDQDLRRMISEETAPLRNAILAYALSKTGLQGSV